MQNTPRWLLIPIATISLSVVLCSCQTGDVIPVSTAAPGKIPKTAGVYVVTPHNGNYGDQIYEGSGSAVASAFDSAFSHFADNVVVGPYCDSTTSAVDAAKAHHCSFVVIPKIAHWEDRATEWSGKRDKMELFVRILNVADESEVRSVEITGKSRWLTFGGDHPQDLLADPIQDLVESLYDLAGYERK